ncbi:hypothetical protein Hdeb2414_s0025g00665931 [Helianthus debilis subsp. tardiflorus]
MSMSLSQPYASQFSIKDDITKRTKTNLDGKTTSTPFNCFGIDFKKISDGLTRDKSFNPKLHTKTKKKKTSQSITYTVIHHIKTTST